MLIGYTITRIEYELSKILPVTTIKCKNCKRYSKNGCKILKGKPYSWQYCCAFDKKQVIKKDTKTYCQNCHYLGKFVEEKRSPHHNERKVEYQCTCRDYDLIPEGMDGAVFKKGEVKYDLKFKGCKKFKTNIFRRILNHYLLWRN